MTTDLPAIIVSATPEKTGAAAGRMAADALRAAMASTGRARVIFAAAPSQDDMITTLAAQDLNWGAVHALHMDEYIGLRSDHPQSFGQWLADRLPAGLGSFERIQPSGDPEAERRRYDALLEEPVDLVCMGVGVNGHIAFNEPGSVFDDTERVRKIELDPTSRRQQVDDGCFADLAEVPTSALTVTIPPLVSAASIVCTVLGSRKAAAVAAALTGEIGPQCPASILQRCPQASIHLDERAAALLPADSTRPAKP